MFTDFINYKRAPAIVRREIRRAKKNYWREFCNKIGVEIEINELWGMIRKMGGIQRNTSIPVLIDDNNIAVTDSDKAEILVETFKVHSNANVSEDMRRYREQCVMDHAQIFVKKNPDGGTLDSDFTLYEKSIGGD